MYFEGEKQSATHLKNMTHTIFWVHGAPFFYMARRKEAKWTFFRDTFLFGKGKNRCAAAHFRSKISNARRNLKRKGEKRWLLRKKTGGAADFLYIRV